MKKKKPILILLGIILIVLVILFFALSKKPAGENAEGGALRRFFNFGSRTSQQGTGNETGGDLLNGGINPLTGREYTDEELRLLRQEQERANREQGTTFTGQQPINPFDPNSQGGFSPTGDFGDTPPPPPVTTITTRPPINTPSGPACSDVDLYITFTEEEKAQIAKLQQRFDAIAGNLVSDQDVKDEENNYSGFVVRTERFAELTKMCTDTMALAASNPYSTLRIPTPFWKDEKAFPSFIARHIQARDQGVQIFGNVNLEHTNVTYTIPLLDSTISIPDTTGGIPFNWFEILYRLYIW